MSSKYDFYPEQFDIDINNKLEEKESIKRQTKGIFENKVHLRNESIYSIIVETMIDIKHKYGI